MSASTPQLDFQPLAPRNEESVRPSSVRPPRKNGSKNRDEKTQEARQLKLQAFEHSRQMGLTLDMLKQKSRELASLVELVSKSKDHGNALMAQNTQFMWRAAAAEAALSDASSNCEALAHALELHKNHAAAEQSAAAKQHTANAQKIEALEKNVTKLQAEVVTAESKLQVDARDQQAKIREQPQLLTPALRVARPDLSSSSSGVAKPVNAASPTLKPPAASTSPAPVIVASGATKVAVAADLQARSPLLLHSWPPRSAWPHRVTSRFPCFEAPSLRLPLRSPLLRQNWRQFMTSFLFRRRLLGTASSQCRHRLPLLVLPYYPLQMH